VEKALNKIQYHIMAKILKKIGIETAMLLNISKDLKICWQH
jgi:hypothetical protein